MAPALHEMQSEKRAVVPVAGAVFRVPHKTQQYREQEFREVQKTKCFMREGELPWVLEGAGERGGTIAWLQVQRWARMGAPAGRGESCQAAAGFEH